MKYLVLPILALALPLTLQAANLAHNVSGRILIAVEARGAAWYINPVDEHRYSLGRPEDAWAIMTKLGLGISNANLAKIPTVTENFGGDRNLRARLAGRIVLQVEDRGQAWYIDPVSLKRVYLGRPADAYVAMQKYGLGITNANLNSIPMTALSSSIPTPATSSATILYNVPFVAQAPFGDWSDPRQQDGCEESSALMAVAWARGESLTPTQARDQIMAMSDWEKSQFGYFEDTSAVDTATRLVDTYLGFKNYEIKQNISTSDIKQQLESGHVVLLTVNGRALNNPHFIAGGPERHMIVVVGYDAATDEFIAHDPGTGYGGNYRYSNTTLTAALQDYTSGNHVPIGDLPTALVVIKQL